MVHETFPGSGRSWKKISPSSSDFFLFDFQVATLIEEGESVKGVGFCVKYLILDRMCSVSSEQRGSYWQICNRLKAGLGAPGLPALNGFFYFSVTHGVVTAENSSCLSPDMQKQHCESTSNQEKHFYSFYSINFIYQLGMFWHMLYFDVGQRWHLNAEDSCFCLVKFPMWHWLHRLWPWGVKVVPLYVKCSIPWAVRARFWCIFLLFPAPDGPPQDVQLEPISSQSIRVTWKVNSYTSTDKIGSVSIWVLSGE